MADVFIEDGEILGRVGKKTLVHVVRGDKGPQPNKAGQILDTYFARNGENHLLDVKWVTREGVRQAAEEIRIKPYYRRRGWITLQDAYLAEDNKAGYAEFLEFSQQQRQDPIGMHGVEFSHEKLPKIVQELIRGRGADKAGTEKWKKAAEPQSKPAAKPKVEKKPGAAK
ncbi:MAG: hypothetical protein ACRBBM_17455 [Pseudomonadaceae bacterium]